MMAFHFFIVEIISELSFVCIKKIVSALRILRLHNNFHPAVFVRTAVVVEVKLTLSGMVNCFFEQKLLSSQIGSPSIHIPVNWKNGVSLFPDIPNNNVKAWHRRVTETPIITWVFVDQESYDPSRSTVKPFIRKQPKIKDSCLIQRIIIGFPKSMWFSLSFFKRLIELHK